MLRKLLYSDEHDNSLSNSIVVDKGRKMECVTWKNTIITSNALKYPDVMGLSGVGGKDLGNVVFQSGCLILPCIFYPKVFRNIEAVLCLCGTDKIAGSHPLDICETNE